jgi:hypothetical protein
MGRTTIPCKDETRDRLAELRGDQYSSWDAFLLELADAWEDDAEVPEGFLAIQDADAEDIEHIKRSLETVEGRTGKIESILEKLQP